MATPFNATFLVSLAISVLFSEDFKAPKTFWPENILFIYASGTVFTDTVDESILHVNKAAKADAIIDFVLPCTVFIESHRHTQTFRNALRASTRSSSKTVLFIAVVSMK
jgi:hypothetical protein